jgi:chromosomal replication initiator protein
MNYNERDLHKVYSLAKRGFNFQESLEALKTDRIKACDGDKLQILVNSICNYYHVTIEELTGRTRFGYIVEARRMYCYLARVLTPKSLKSIGKKISRDHATVLHQFKQVSGYVDVNDRTIISDIDDVTLDYYKNLKIHELETNKELIDV